ncbi:hypothetical protein LLG10_07150 [bacterium]|nr:hypothetical protein [bacterium]
MLTFLFYWLIHQYMLYSLQIQFIPSPPMMSSSAILEEVMDGYYRCPNDYLMFPDEEALMFHWQLEHPFNYETYLQADEQVRESWLASLKIQK